MSSPPARARRAARPSGDDRQRAIVDTLERLLQDRALADIAIDDLAGGAAISRPTFYFYFASKQAVLLELVDRLVAEVDARLALLPAIGEDPDGWWRAALSVFVDVFSAHRAVTLTLDEARSSEEVRAVWSERSGRWTRQTAAVIATERARGAARAGVDAEALSTALNAMNEGVLVATIGGFPGAIAAESVLDVLLDVWTTSIYGTRRASAEPSAALDL